LPSADLIEPKFLFFYLVTDAVEYFLNFSLLFFGFDSYFKHFFLLSGSLSSFGLALMFILHEFGFSFVVNLFNFLEVCRICGFT